MNLLESSGAAFKSKSSEKNGISAYEKPEKKKKKKSKESAATKEENHDSGKKATEHKHKNKEKSKPGESMIEEVNLLGTPVKTKSSKDKTKKEKKSSKKRSDEKSKSGYEEALGISTPSKEINWVVLRCHNITK